jgi:hypothetical protein
LLSDTQHCPCPIAKRREGEAERGEDDQNDVPPHDLTLLGVDDPGIYDQVDHAPCGGGPSKDPWQHGTIMSLGPRGNHPPTAPDESEREGLPYGCRETPWPFNAS